MPKFAATLASLLLIASAIGINIARYPQVGRTVDTGQRTDSAEPTKSAPVAEEPSRVEMANPDSLTASNIKIEPAKPPQVVAVVPPKTARVEESVSPKPAADVARLKPEPVVSILDVRPMVPVARLRTTGEADPPPGSDEVRRLPPVEPSGSAVPEIQATGSDNALPYIATSTP